MIVAVEGRLNHIKDELQQRGYHVVGLGDHQSVDAIVYYNDGKYLEHNGAEMNYTSFFSGESAVRGAFMVNAHNKGIDEIDQMLKKRRYSPLFNNFQ